MATTQAPGNYPDFKVDHISNPMRFYAVPLIGFLAKVVMLIPVYFYLFILGVAVFFLLIINSLVVLFTGKYWPTCYNLVLGVMRYTTKMMLFFWGLSNKYPGFSLNNDDPLISVDMAMPTNPNRWYAFPVFGGLARLIIIIPYAIYQSVIQNAAGLGVFVSFIPVLFMGKYPEATYEMARDSHRVGLSSQAFFSGFSDSYPSFKISMNHKTVKIILIVFGALAVLWNWTNTVMTYSQPKQSDYQYDYQYDMDQQAPTDAQYQELLQQLQEQSGTPMEYEMETETVTE